MSKYLILMSDNRTLNNSLDLSDYNSLTCFLNYEYSKKNGYNFFYLNPILGDSTNLYNCLSPSGELRHPSWSKIISTLKVIFEFKEYEKIIYIDSDCIFLNTEINLDEYLDNVKNINNEKLTHKDKIVFLNNLPWSDTLPCAGFFIVENTPKIENFLKKWYSNENHKMKNTQHDWEQTILQRELCITDIESIEVINDWMFRSKENQFLRHIGSEESHNRIPFFKNIIEKNYSKEYYSLVISELQNNIITYDTKNFKFDYNF